MKQKVTDIFRCLLLGFLPFSLLICDEIEILESGGTAIVFDYSPESPILQTTSEGTHIKARNCDYTEETGKPLLPIRTFHVGVPQATDYSVEILSIETDTRHSADILPVPEIGSRGGVSQYYFVKDEDFYSTDDYYPREEFFTKPASFLRQQKILPVSVPLARYNPRQRSLIVLKRIRIRVSFASTPKEGLWKEDEFEKVYKTLLVNYEQSKLWRNSRKMRKQTVDPFGQSNFWYRISICDEGLYKIGYADCINLGINPASIDPRTLKLYNGGSKPLPENLNEPRPLLQEIPIWVEGEEDGKFGPEDYLVFYGVSTCRWEYDDGADRYDYFENLYSDTNVFWFTWGGEEGLRMEVQDGSPHNPNPASAPYFWTAIRIEENRNNPSKTAFRWVDEVIPEMGEKIYSFDCHGADSASPADFCVRLRLGKLRGTPVVHKYEIYFNGTLLVKDSMYVHSNETERWIRIDTLVPLLMDKNNEIIVKQRGGPTSVLNVDFFEIEYNRKYTAKHNQLSFTFPREFDPGIREFEITEFTSSTPFLLDVTDPLSPKRVLNLVTAEHCIRFQTDPENRRFYHLTCSEKLRNVPRNEIADLHHLRSSEGGDYIALVYGDLFYATQPLISWRQQQFQNPVVVDISSVYDEFSWGLKDPTAIRDFLKYWYDNAAYQPSYCLLVGDGTYDYKNYLMQENRDNLIPATSRCQDNWYGMLQPEDSYRDVCIGRITCHSPQEAQVIIATVIDYEKRPNYGFWRNRILLLADNRIQRGGDFPGDIEELARENIPAHFDIRKIHLLYRTYDDSHEWPVATEDAIEEWSQGFLAGCYMGHGGPHTVADEQLLLYKDIFSFKNGVKLPFFYFASCDIGRFDVPNDPCLGEDLLKLDDGGAIAAIAASRGTFHPDNREIAFKLFDAIFFGSPTPTIGEAFLIAKPGNSVHTLFGDPATTIGSATSSIKVSASPDSLVSRCEVSVMDSVPPGFSGYANIYVFDSAELYYVDSLDLVLHIPGVPIFKGTIRCENVDTLRFTVPRGLHLEGELGRINCYAWNDTLEIVGLLDSLKVGGSGPVTSDTTGPSVLLFEGDRLLADGDFVPPACQLTGVLEDPSGIYIVPRKPPWFLLEVNRYKESGLSRFFTYDVDSSTKGRFNYALRLNEGENEIKVVAKDNVLNTTAKTVKVQVTTPSEITIKYAFNYPNPITDWTYFTFYLTQDAECEIKIFTVSGNLIKWIKNIHAATGQNQIYWDGKDSDGDAMANGVYIYKILARSYTDSAEWGRTKAETSLIEKLVIMR